MEQKSDIIRGGGWGVIGTQALHSDVKLLHKCLSKLLQIHKEAHSLALFS